VFNLNSLDIKNLSVEIDNKIVLKNINLTINNGEKHVLLGPNASGKSSLLYSLMGFPNYKIKSGTIFFNNTNISNLTIEQRAWLGIAAIYQNPPEISIKLSKLLSTISQKKINLSKINNLLDRDVNVGFSGGERKLSELMQVVSLNPNFVMLDEFDAGLDVENLKNLSFIANQELSNSSVLLITHRGKALKFFNPDFVHVLLDGKIICSSNNWKKIWNTIKEDGYERCKKCALSSKR